jgi:hypothetical protein
MVCNLNLIDFPDFNIFNLMFLNLCISVVQNILNCKIIYYIGFKKYFLNKFKVIVTLFIIL